jgi:hypothetical protein
MLFVWSNSYFYLEYATSYTNVVHNSSVGNNRPIQPHHSSELEERPSSIFYIYSGQKLMM